MSKNEDYKNIVDAKDGEISNDANKKEEINSTSEVFNDNENNGMIFDKPDEIPEFDLIPNIFEASQNEYNTEAEEVLISNHQPLSINEILHPLIDNYLTEIRGEEEQDLKCVSPVDALGQPRKQ